MHTQMPPVNAHVGMYLVTLCPERTRPCMHVPLLHARFPYGLCTRAGLPGTPIPGKTSTHYFWNASARPPGVKDRLLIARFITARDSSFRYACVRNARAYACTFYCCTLCCPMVYVHANATRGRPFRARSRHTNSRTLALDHPESREDHSLHALSPPRAVLTDI